jgi:hypothetical protein
MSFISDFIAYSSGTMCPPTYIQWASIFPIAVAAGRRYFFNQGRLIIKPELCLCFVGQSGNKKSFGKDLAKDIIVKAMPDMPVAADITSRDDLMRMMASKDSLRFYVNHEGAECEWHPMTLFVDEMRHFMSYSPSAMIAFLVAIYGQKRFIGSTIKRGVEDIVEPCLNLIGCTTEDWINEHLKTGILAGGWSRRFIVIYVPGISKVPIAIPQRHPDADQLEQRMDAHLQKVQTGSGQFKWGKGAEAYFTEWFNHNYKHLPENEHERAFFLTKDQMLLKICMLLDLGEEKPSLVISTELLEAGLAMFDLFEGQLPHLYLSAGRNELAVPQQRLLDLVYATGGIAKSDLMTKVDRHMTPMEHVSIMRHLVDSKRIVVRSVQFTNGSTEMVLTPKKFAEVMANGGRWVE